MTKRDISIDILFNKGKRLEGWETYSVCRRFRGYILAWVVLVASSKGVGSLVARRKRQGGRLRLVLTLCEKSTREKKSVREIKMRKRY